MDLRRSLTELQTILTEHQPLLQRATVVPTLAVTALAHPLDLHTTVASEVDLSPVAQQVALEVHPLPAVLPAALACLILSTRLHQHHQILTELPFRRTLMALRPTRMDHRHHNMEYQSNQQHNMDHRRLSMDHLLHNMVRQHSLRDLGKRSSRGRNRGKR